MGRASLATLRSVKLGWLCVFAVISCSQARVVAQRVVLPPSSASAATRTGPLRPIAQSGEPGLPSGVNTLPQTMVPINPATQAGVYPSVPSGGTTFDPYATTPPISSVPVPSVQNYPGVVGGPAAPSAPSYQPPLLNNGAAVGGQAPSTLGGGYPGYTGPPPVLPGAGASGTLGTFPSTGGVYPGPNPYPNSSPSALFPAPYGTAPPQPGLFSELWTGLFGGNPNTNWSAPPTGYGGGPGWNPSGTLYGGTGGAPTFIRLIQGVRVRHAFIYGDNGPDALEINDSDISVTIVYPNFLYSTQPLYLMPSFSLHTWEGPITGGGITADLPGAAYSAFLDTSWQSDPSRIFGAELGLRVGMFSDFDTAISDSLRLLGRGIGRVRLTPRATLKAGVIYLDRNRVKLLPAGGLLWQPNVDTRFDLFFPEPKLSHYLSTLGTTDIWWYVGGYYGGGSWTVERANGVQESIDLNDIRLVFGLEWGNNQQMREGTRVGFFEGGFVFDRELLYKSSVADNMRLPDTFTLRAGFGY
ncbi:MAG: hypothetical protein KatS3mg111_0137 [Pirellulaceae bacterium]|nr:MAG: hypothetical protein KatS3mg111_0137 [Pirellulaceae bacterium]